MFGTKKLSVANCCSYDKKTYLESRIVKKEKVLFFEDFCMKLHTSQMQKPNFVESH